MIQATLKKLWLCIFCLSLLTVLTVGCVSNHFSHRAVNQDTQAKVPKAVVAFNTNQANELRARLEQIARAAQGWVGVSATVLETGESVSLNGQQRFPMQSVYKFPIAMAVLAQVDQGKLKLEQKIRVQASDIVQGSRILDEHSQEMAFTLAALLKYMVSESDNTACDMLLRLLGKPKLVTQYLRGLGVNDMVVANTEKELAQDPAVQYRNDATPDAAVVLLRAFHEGKGLSSSSQALLRQWMTETTTGPKRLQGLLPKGTVVAHKTGTSATVNGVTAATNDVGLVTLPSGQPLAIAVFVADAKASEVMREAVIAKVTKAAWDEWSKEAQNNE
jgi:beta-lactamase class A